MPDLRPAVVTSEPYKPTGESARRDRIGNRQSVVDQLHNENDFRNVISVLDSVRAELGSTASAEAAEVQSQASRAQWLSFVSKRSGDTTKVEAKASDLAAGTPHAEMVSKLHPLDARDGVIEISFAADLKAPQEPVRIVGVRVRVVARALAERIRTMNPMEVPIPTRVVGQDLTFGGQSIADPAISIARNEVGEITVAAGKPGELADTNQEARYLAAKHARERSHQRRDADVKAGGRRLVEGDIAQPWNRVMSEFDEVANRHEMRIETDDGSKKKL